VAAPDNLQRRATDLDEILYADAKCHSHDDKQLKIETGNKIPIWRTFVFYKPEAEITQPWIEISSKFDAHIDFDIPKRASAIIKTEVGSRFLILYSRHL